MATYEIELRTTQQSLDVGSPGASLMANNLEIYNGKIGPIIPYDFPEIPGDLTVGDTLIVRLVNDLPIPSGIHWHGIELQNNADGTPVTQAALRGGDLQVLGGVGGDPVGGTYLYRFEVTRPGIFWFHPHHYHSTNRVFRGSYGMIIVKDPNEAALIAGDVIPDATNTEQLILSDITVCAAAGSNVPYDPSLPWVGGPNLPAQPGLSPENICETSPVDEDGNPGPAFGAGEVPNLQRAAQRINEGLTVLTNGRNVGGRGGSPAAPGTLEMGAQTLSVQPGQGLRLQIVNCATTRYFRLILTMEDSTQVPLVRIGGEGGLLDHAVLEGGAINGFDTKYTAGEILLPPATRADVVAAIPDTATGTLTMWTQDFPRLAGAGPFTNTPTVPVLHLAVSGAAVSPPYTITGGPNGVGGTPLRASIAGQAVETLGPATATLQDPAFFGKPGMAAQEITLSPGPPPGVNNIAGSFSGFTPYTSTPHIASTRYAKEGDVLELTVTNSSSAHHPFHLHGFSFQPLSLAPASGTGSTFNWQYREFRDTMDIPNNYSLTFRVRIEDRALNDGVTMGGALGRWLFHCHIFFHAHRGMISELVITDPDGSGDEKPYIDVNGSWTYAPTGGSATRDGTYFLPDGDTVSSIVAHREDGTPIGTISSGGGNWSWISNAPADPPLPDQTNYVYVTITGASGRKDQTVFRLKIGGSDDGSDNGDPHIHTVDGRRYDFQAVGEFTLLRDRQGMEVQARQTPVAVANPITDSYSSLTTCVSLNTAAAARVGSHRISYQLGPERKRLQFFLDGELWQLPHEGLDLDGHLVSTFDANGSEGLRVDYAHHPVLEITPHFWNKHGMWYLNVRISHTQGTEGIMGSIPEGSWLPRLRSGAQVGQMPASLTARYNMLYKTFAESWRVNDQNSLFVYAPGTSTATYTDRAWPAEKPPCKLQPQLEFPGAPLHMGMPLDEARRICRGVTEDDLHRDCVFDVATTGDESFARDYLVAQDLRLRGSAVRIIGEQPCPDLDYQPGIAALVTPLRSGRPTPTGYVTFLVDGMAVGRPVRLDKYGRACLPLQRLQAVDHNIQAIYRSDEKEYGYHASKSPIFRYRYEEEKAGV